jgi:hypothetical protein
MLKLICGVKGGIFARIEASEDGPTLTYELGAPSGETFVSQEGGFIGRWALGEKKAGRVPEFRFRRRIVLREPRRYRSGERWDGVVDQTSGRIGSWCEHCRHEHVLDLAALYSAVRGGRASGELVVAETVR